MVAVVLVSCGSDAESGPTLAPDADVVIGAAAEVMGSIETVRFTLERGGAPVHIDPLGSLEFIEAEGRFEGPSSADAVVVVSAGGVRVQVGAVAIDGEMWLTNPITGSWEPTPEGYDLDPAALFDPEIGFRPLLAELEDPTLVGLETRGGVDVYHVTGVAAADQVSTVTAGLVRDQDVTVDLWLDPVDGALHEVEFTTLHGGESSDWRITFSDYGADLTVETPDLEG